MVDGKDDVVIIDEDSSFDSSSSAAMLRKLVFEHLSRISIHIFQVGETTMTEKKGIMERIDRRDQLSFSIDYLHALLQPKYDDEMKKYMENFNNKLKQLEMNLYMTATKYAASQQCRGDSKVYSQWITYYKNHSLALVDKSQLYFDIYLQKKYELYQELFQQINFLLDRLNYLAEEDYVE